MYKFVSYLLLQQKNQVLKGQKWSFKDHVYLKTACPVTRVLCFPVQEMDNPVVVASTKNKITSLIQRGRYVLYMLKVSGKSQISEPLERNESKSYITCTVFKVNFHYNSFSDNQILRQLKLYKKTEVEEGKGKPSCCANRFVS